MSYYADPDRYYYGTTAREAFEELDRLESRIARDRVRASLSSTSRPDGQAERPGGGGVTSSPDRSAGSPHLAGGAGSAGAPGPAANDEVTGRQIDLFGRLAR